MDALPPPPALPALRLLPLLLLLCPAPLCLAAAPCPRSCTCPQPSDLHCTFRSLLSVPQNINPRVERINLGFNSISRLPDRSLAGLTRLEMLLIHGNDLHSLPDGAFKDLSALQMLKLSYNRLREVCRHTFVGLWSLGRLHLDHNGLESIDPDAFHGLTSLRLLQLEGNRLKRLHASTFATFTLADRFHLSTIRHLFLSNNSLGSLPRDMIQTMPQLETLFLHSNPWVCDCGLRWILRWLQTSPGVHKCKKEKSLPGGHLCPICSSPRNLHQKPLQVLDDMVCSSPAVRSKDRPAAPEETDDDFAILDDFKTSFGNVSLELSDEHGNDVKLECSAGKPRDASKISFELLDSPRMASNVTLSLDLDCDVDREKYERLWRLIAYYSSTPAHLKRGIMLTKDPSPMYVYKQDLDKDALYYTGVKANIMALPTWLMQAYLDLQLNRHESSGKTVRLILTTQFSQNLDLEIIRRQPRTWVRVEETSSTCKTVMLGKAVDLQCSVQSTGEPIITWILPDGTKVVAPSGTEDKRLSVSADGVLTITTAEHRDAGSYHCVAKVDEDVAVLAFHVSVQDSSNPQPGEDQAMPTEVFAGSSLSLDCEALGSPDPRVDWIIPNGNIVSFRSNLSRVFVYPNGTLHIPQSSPPDNGFYKCVALNRYGVDTKAAKVTVNRRPGAVRTLRRFPMRPQSAAGINTKVKLQMKDFDEGSGDSAGESYTKPIHEGAPVRNGVYPSRKNWRRPPIVLRKSTLQNTESRKNILDHRRRMNTTKINPERWADILAMIRIKNSRLTPTSSPAIATTTNITTKFSALSNYGQEEKSTMIYGTTSALDMTSSARAIEGSSEGAREKAGHAVTAAPESTATGPLTTTEPLTSQSFPSWQPPTSSYAFFPVQTTSAPLQAVTLWHARLNTLRRGMTDFQPGHIQPAVGNPAGSKRLRAKWNRKSNPRLSKLKRVKGGRVASTVVPVTSNWEDKLMSSTQKPQLQTIISTVSPTTEQIWNTQPTKRGQYSKRRNGNRKKKPNRRINKPNKSVKDVSVRKSVSEVTPLPTALKIDTSSEPSSHVQKRPEFSESTLVHEKDTKSQSSLEQRVPGQEEPEHIESKLGKKTTTKNYPEPSKTRLFTDNQVEGSITSARPDERPDVLLSNPQQEFTGHSLAPVKPLAQTPEQNAIADSPSEEPRRAKGKLIQSGPGLMALGGHKHLADGSREQLASRSSLLTALTEHNAEEMYTSEPIATTGIGFEVSTVTKVPEAAFITSSENAPQDAHKGAGKTQSATALPMTIPNFARAITTTAQPEPEGSLQLSPKTRKKPHNQSAAFPIKTTTAQTFKVTAQHADNSNKHQLLHDEVVIRGRNIITQTPGILLKTEIDEYSRGTPANLISLHTSPLNSETAPTTALSPSVLTQQVPTTKDLKISQRKTNSPLFPPNSIPSTTFAPSTLSYTVPTISRDRETIKQDQKIQDKSTSSSHHFDQFSTPASLPLRTVTEQAVSIDDSSKSDQISQDDLLKTSSGATQPPTSALLDFVTPSSDQFISPNPTIPAITAKTTPEPEDRVTRVAPQTTRPRGRTTPKLPVRADYPAGKPRITESNFQTISIKAETDVVLPCAAVGNPKPVLSWTKVSTGTSIPQNTRLQRFEVHENGSLIIRNTQPLDGGEYLCTVQNQHGSDRALANLVVLSQHPKVLQPRHRDITVNLGSNVDIDCQVEGHPKPRVTWVLPNHAQVAAATTLFELAQTQPNRLNILQNGTLRIIQAALSDRGIYKCVGSSTSGADTVSVRLYVSVLLPAFRQRPIENVTATEDGEVFLHCTANGAPPPTIHWTTPNSILLTTSQFLNGGKIRVLPNGTLFMQGLTQGNAGRYECLASNFLGTSKRTVNLFVKGKLQAVKPSIVYASGTLTEVVYGGELKLDCVAKGHPQPKVVWRMPSKRVVDSFLSLEPRIRVHPNGSLHVSSVTDKDAGSYLCVARNKMGDDYAVARVEVLTKPAKIERKRPRSSQEVAYGGDLKVDCVASGLPDPEISWALPDGTMIHTERPLEPAGGRTRRFVVFDNGTLFFNEVGMREEGDYTCYAENQLGKDEMKIHVKVKAGSTPPRVLSKTNTALLRVVYGGNFTLQCDAEGEPTPVFTWISPMNRIIISNREKYQVSADGKLMVLRAQRSDAGDYTCTARNAAGQDGRVIKVEVIVMPPVIRGAQGQSTKVSVPQDGRVLLDCDARGTPYPRILWVLPGNVIMPAPYHSNRMTVFHNGTLEIRSVKRSDAGSLACIARNEGGEVRSAVSLEVGEAKATMSSSGAKMETVWLTAGNAMTLNCLLDGDNFRPVTWVLPNGTPLQSGAQSMKFFHRQDGSLLIRNPTLAEAGTYRCMGRDNGVYVERIVQLAPRRKPEIRNRYNSSVSIAHGEMLMLHCMAHGEPLRLTWTLPSGVILNRPQKAGRYSVLQNGTLAIQQTGIYDRGMYVCRAGNEYGSSLMSASVIVVAYPPRITNVLNSVTFVKRGEATQLNCAATGIPDVEVAWETPDKTRLLVSAQPRVFGNKYLHPQGSLVIQNPTQRDTGLYRCTARNTLGVDSKATYLSVF